MPLFSPLLACIVPFLFLAVFLFAAVKKVKIYDAFTEGAKQAVPLLLNIFPYLVTIFILSEIFEQSGLSDKLCDLLNSFRLYSFFINSFFLAGYPARTDQIGRRKTLFGQRRHRSFCRDLTKQPSRFVRFPLRRRLFRLIGDDLLRFRRLFCKR